MEAEQVIRQLGLEPLEPEGGHCRQTYASKTLTQEGECAGTAIYYLLEDGEFSHMHRLSGDEVYHFYLGDPVELLLLYADGTSEKVRLGSDLSAGEHVQYVVPAGTWQGSCVAAGGSWALMGTTMCPGYSDACYEHGNGDELVERYPLQAHDIRKLTTPAAK